MYNGFSLTEVGFFYSFFLKKKMIFWFVWFGEKKGEDSIQDRRNKRLKLRYSALK